MVSQQAVYASGYGGYSSRAAQSEHMAEALFNRSLSDGRKARAWQWLRRQSQSLSYLPLETPLREVQASHRQQVSLNAIKGSVSGRVNDFDASFRPRTSHSQSRWISVATARQKGVKLPPVELIQVSDDYYVVDGHHRLSVMQAVGQDEIEANVTVCEMTGPIA